MTESAGAFRAKGTGHIRPTNAKGPKKMMSDKEFAELELRATICPVQFQWPKPEYVVWQKLHEAANEARARVSKAYMQMDEIDRNAELSRDGKYRQRSKTAAQAIADFEASKTLARAREAVELVVASRAYRIVSTKLMIYRTVAAFSCQSKKVGSSNSIFPGNGIRLGTFPWMHSDISR
jgi:hypothetical protein